MARRTSSRTRSNRTGGGGRAWWWLPFVALLVLLIWWGRERSIQKRRKTSPPPVTQTLPKPPPFTSAAPVSVIRETNFPPPSPLPPVTNPVVAAPVIPPAVTPGSSRSVTNMVEAQIVLMRHGISSGSVDGVGGAQTALALKAFQRQYHLEESGRLDRDTLAELLVDRPLYTRRLLTDADLTRPLPVPTTWLGKSQALRLDHNTLLELVAEEAHAHPDFIRRLNPGVNWETVTAGTEVTVPAADFPPARRANLVRVNLTEKWVRAFDTSGDLLCHFPCSIGRIAEKRPVGELQVAVAVKDPNYTFNPEVFPESEEGRSLGRKLVIPPGPNNPVGVAWIGLSKPGYGLHGTPNPEQVGRTESHGCFRLANWNAEYLRQMVRVGTPVWIE